VVIDADGQPHYIPPDDMSAQQFFSLPGKEASLDAAPEWHEYNPDLRTEDNHRAVQDMLDLFSFKCGLGCHRYSFELGKVATATEYTGSASGGLVSVVMTGKHQVTSVSIKAFCGPSCGRQRTCWART